MIAKKSGGGNHLVLMGSILVCVVWIPVVVWVGVQETIRWSIVEWTVLVASAVVHILYFRSCCMAMRYRT